jgi:hypothetical protein
MCMIPHDYREELTSDSGQTVQKPVNLRRFREI